MRMRNKVAATVAVASIVMFGIVEVYSKSFGSRSFSSSRSFSFKSSSPKVTRAPVKSYKYTKATTPKKQAKSNSISYKDKKKKSGSMSKFNSDKKISTTMKNRVNNQVSKKSYKDYTNKFKKKTPVKSKTSYNKVTNANVNKKYSSAADQGILDKSRNYDRNTYYSRRNQHYAKQSYDPYVYDYSPSYGMYDSRGLWGMNDPTFFYNHQSSPGVSLFLADMLLESHRNAEVRRQLDEINRKMAQMKTAGTPVNTSYVPKGIDADVLLIPDVASANRPTIRLCSGSSKGTYYFVGETVKRISKNVKVTTTKSSGSMDNLARMERGECDAAFVQRDAYSSYLKSMPSSTLNLTKMTRMYNEYAHLICSRDSGITSVSDLTKDITVLTGAKGSGSAITWNNITSHVDDIKSKTDTATSMSQALALILEDEAQCVVAVTSLKSTLMSKTEKVSGEYLRLIDIKIPNIKEITDPTGKSLYTPVSIDDDNYDSLTEGLMWISWDTDSVTVPMDVVVKDSWIKKNKTPYSEWTNEVVDFLGDIRLATNSK